MSKEQITKKKCNYRLILARLLLFIGIPAVLMLFWQFGDRKYYLCSLVLIVLVMVPFLARFETRKPQPRELVTLAVLCAIAVASRAAFVMIPHFKPMLGIIMISAMAFGADAGFLVGAMSVFASNFIFGQGMWTPWQMFAYGLGGFLAGLFYQWELMSEKTPGQRIVTAVIGFLMVIGLVGPVLDLSSVFTMGNAITLEWAMSIFVSGFPVNIIHGVATALTLFILSRPMMEKLDRIKLKYGMMGEEF